MFCPNCGKSNSNEQKFCRTCGLALDETLRSLIAQKGENLDLTFDKRTKTVDRLLTVLGIGGGAAFLIAIIGTILFKIILERGNVWSGVGLITFILLAVVMLILVVYRESLLENAQKNQKIKEPPAESPEILQIADPHFEAVPSVTERTTNLLKVDRPKFKTHELD